MRAFTCILFVHVLFPALALADAEQPAGYHGWGMMPWGVGGMMFMMPVMFILVVAVILAVIFTVRHVGGSERGYAPHTHSETPLEILQKRYARGEIDREDFERMKKDLQD